MTSSWSTWLGLCHNQAIYIGLFDLKFKRLQSVNSNASFLTSISSDASVRLWTCCENQVTFTFPRSRADGWFPTLFSLALCSPEGLGLSVLCPVTSSVFAICASGHFLLTFCLVCISTAKPIRRHNNRRRRYLVLCHPKFHDRGCCSFLGVMYPRECGICTFQFSCSVCLYKRKRVYTSFPWYRYGVVVQKRWVVFETRVCYFLRT